jgi:SAM-dependent methyltransferase
MIVMSSTNRLRPSRRERPVTSDRTQRNPDTSEAPILAAYRGLARAYDEHTRVAQRLRRMVVSQLRLHPGDTVVDVGCGTGLCFPMIMEAIGPTGYLIGVEESADMLAHAQERIKRGGWDNVDLVCSPGETAQLPVRADAALFCLTHDILTSRQALDNVFTQLRPGARVAATGPKWASWRDLWWAPWLVPEVNLAVLTVNRPYVRSFRGFDHPWRYLGGAVPDLRVKPLLFGGAYVAWGALPDSASPG